MEREENEQSAKQVADLMMGHGGWGLLETQTSGREPWSNNLYGKEPLEVQMSVFGS